MKITYFFVHVIIWGYVKSQNTIQSEQNINKSILNASYDKTIRPTESIDIGIEIALKQILTLDEKSQTITTVSYLFVNWYDIRLIWSPVDYSNIKTISIGAKNLWLPHLFVTNTADSNGFISITDNNLAFVSSDGLVYLTLSLIGNYYNHTL